ncbi:MAG: hypothetical protein WCR21_05250 [Bacteroidota bacterium]
MEKYSKHQLQFDFEDYAAFCNKSKDEQIHELLAQAIHLDTMLDNNFKTLLFFLRGFFVEVSISTTAERIIDILPIKDGYKIEQYLFQIQDQFYGNPVLS